MFSMKMLSPQLISMQCQYLHIWEMNLMMTINNLIMNLFIRLPNQLILNKAKLKIWKSKALFKIFGWIKKTAIKKVLVRQTLLKFNRIFKTNKRTICQIKTLIISWVWTMFRAHNSLTSLNKNSKWINKSMIHIMNKI
jgi:hypothetical protein